MKIAFRILSLVILVAMTTVFTGCKKDGDNEKTQEQIQFEKLKGVWTIESAIDDAGDRTSDFINEDDPQNIIKMKLTLEGNYVKDGKWNYSLTGPRPVVSPWPPTGTWTFGTNKLTELIRDPSTPDEIPMSYSVADSGNGSILEIEFTVPEGKSWPGSRISSVEGKWTFTFTK